MRGVIFRSLSLSSSAESRTLVLFFVNHFAYPRSSLMAGGECAVGVCQYRPSNRPRRDDTVVDVERFSALPSEVVGRTGGWPVEGIGRSGAGVWRGRQD